MFASHVLAYLWRETKRCLKFSLVLSTVNPKVAGSSVIWEPVTFTDIFSAHRLTADLAP